MLISLFYFIMEEHLVFTKVSLMDVYSYSFLLDLKHYFLFFCEEKCQKSLAILFFLIVFSQLFHFFYCLFSCFQFLTIIILIIIYFGEKLTCGDLVFLILIFFQNDCNSFSSYSSSYLRSAKIH